MHNKKDETIKTKPLLDCGAGKIFMDQNFTWKHGIKITKLDKPITAQNVDGTLNEKGTIRYFADLKIKIDKKTSEERFYITGLSTLDMISKKVSLYTDNQSMIDALSTPKLTSGQYLINTLRTAANAALCKLSINWISGYSKVKGNEAADKLAKDAATGCLSPRTSLPHLLQATLPSSASASKQIFTSSLRTKWKQNWHASP